MKTQIIHCDAFDDLRSLLDRLKWIKARRALLVLPDKDPPVLSQLELTLLKRKGVSMNIELGFVSIDATAKRVIQQAGLPVFENIEESRQKEWISSPANHPVEQRYQKNNERLHYKRGKEPVLPTWLRWLAFSLSVLAVLFLLAALLPGAKVKLNLPREEQIDELIVPAGIDRPTPDLIAGIPLYQVSLEVSAGITQKTTGVVPVGDKPAAGLVVFTNLTDQPVVIPIGARRPFT